MGLFGCNRMILNVAPNGHATLLMRCPLLGQSRKTYARGRADLAKANVSPLADDLHNAYRADARQEPHELIEKSFGCASRKASENFRNHEARNINIRMPANRSLLKSVTTGAVKFRYPQGHLSRCVTMFACHQLLVAFLQTFLSAERIAAFGRLFLWSASVRITSVLALNGPPAMSYLSPYQGASGRMCSQRVVPGWNPKRSLRARSLVITQLFPIELEHH